MTIPTNRDPTTHVGSASAAPGSGWFGNSEPPPAGWQQLLDTAPLAAWTVDLEGRFIWASGRGLERLEQSPAQLLGRSIFDAWQRWPAVLSEVRHSLSGAKPESSSIMAVGDVAFRLWCTAVRDRQGRIAGVQGVATDISEQAQVERTLSESAASWRSLVDSAPEFIYTVDRQGRLLFLNHTMAGDRMEDVIGLEVFRFAPSEDVPRIRAVLEHVFATGETANYEGEWYGLNGERRWLECHFGPLRQDGEVTAVIGLAVDICKRKEAEEKVRIARLELEERVRQRTDELDRSNEALRKEIANAPTRSVNCGPKST